MYKNQVKTVESTINDQEAKIVRLRQELAEKTETIKEQAEDKKALEVAIQELRNQNKGKDN